MSMRNFMKIMEGDHTPPKYDPNDDEHYDALETTGFFGAQAAGCVLMAKSTGRLLLVLRSSGVLEPHTWGCLGGAFKNPETPVSAAKREAHEETGYDGPIQMVPLYVFKKDTFRYSNFLGIVPDEFEPDLGWEADQGIWVEPGNWPAPLHFGMQNLFADSASMNTIMHYYKLFTQR